MSTAMLELTEEAPTIESTDDDTYDHVTCHCRMGLSWCGVELDILIGDPPDLSGDDCPECDALQLQYRDTCPYGCNCTHAMRMLNCADDEETEDE